jgi:hypothetical protein
MQILFQHEYREIEENNVKYLSGQKVTRPRIEVDDRLMTGYGPDSQ